ncbi:hypothetical protein Bbelb_323130 [Branchiostoma belcheri]|nr:hypothetical protein Bbelb_323130 [Branchiostoma belcheri]
MFTALQAIATRGVFAFLMVSLTLPLLKRFRETIGLDIRYLTSEVINGDASQVAEGRHFRPITDSIYGLIVHVKKLLTFSFRRRTTGLTANVCASEISTITQPP